MSWQDLSSAPDPGTRVCARAELRGARYQEHPEDGR